jgi:hypothetical protein
LKEALDRLIDEQIENDLSPAIMERVRQGQLDAIYVHSLEKTQQEIEKHAALAEDQMSSAVIQCRADCATLIEFDRGTEVPAAIGRALQIIEIELESFLAAKERIAHVAGLSAEIRRDMEIKLVNVGQVALRELLNGPSKNDTPEDSNSTFSLLRLISLRAKSGVRVQLTAEARAMLIKVEEAAASLKKVKAELHRDLQNIAREAGTAAEGLVREMIQSGDHRLRTFGAQAVMNALPKRPRSSASVVDQSNRNPQAALPGRTGSQNGKDDDDGFQD